MHLSLLAASLIFLLFFASLPALSANSNKVDQQKQAVGVYSGNINFKQAEPIELSLWFEDKGGFLPGSESLGGFINIGTQGCTFVLPNSRLISEPMNQAFLDKAKSTFKSTKKMVAISIDTKLLGRQRACTRLGLYQYYGGISLQIVLVGNIDKGFQIQLTSKHSNRNIDAPREYNALLQRSAPSRFMQSYIKSYKSYDLGEPNAAELSMLDNPQQVLTPELFAQLVPLSCVEQYKAVKASMKSAGVEDIASYTLNGKRIVRIKRLNDDVYTESYLTSAESQSLSDKQWKFLNYHTEAFVIGANACNQTDILTSEPVAKIVQKYAQKTDPAIDKKWLITRENPIYIIEATGVDVIPAKKDFNAAIREYGKTGLFSPGDETRVINWKVGTQKAYHVPKYKDFHDGKIIKDEDEFVEAFFVPAKAVSTRLNTPILTLLTANKGAYQVCPKWDGEFGDVSCMGMVDSVKPDQIFVTHNKEAALTLFKELSPSADLNDTPQKTNSYNAKCLTKGFCDFPAASFILAIYDNNYGQFKSQNSQYSSALVERYKDHITVTNMILNAAGIATPKEQEVNLFPFFAEHYLHVFDEKYPTCSRTTSELSIRSDTQAYSIVDGFGNTLQDVDSIALYSDYKIPTTMLNICNEICGQTGPSRALSNTANMLFHPNMVKILAGLEKTMDTFACNSPEILTLEAGILGVYQELKTRHKQSPYIERSTFL